MGFFLKTNHPWFKEKAFNIPFKHNWMCRVLAARARRAYPCATYSF